MIVPLSLHLGRWSRRGNGSQRWRHLTTVTHSMGLPRPPRQPHRLAGDRLLAYFAGGHGIASVR
jgi:hypothetical protein